MPKEDQEFEINRPHDAGFLYNFLIDYKFNNALESLPFPIKGLKVLDVCCGSGMISEYYAKKGADVTGIDMSPESIERAKIRKQRFGFEADFSVADATHLPFEDQSFDIVSVHDGLHHIKDPKRAVLEMGRVARRGIVIIEPAKASLTNLSIRLGFSLKYEGEDFVYRFTRAELESWLEEVGFKTCVSRRYLMYYPHKPGRLFRVFDHAIFFCAAKIGFGIMNFILGGVGNKIQVVGER